MLELGLKVFISYLAGSLNGALLVGQLYGGVDIRKSGSGNAGGTNALRTQGKLFAFLVMVVDIGKGVLPVLYLPAMSLAGVGPDPAVSREWLTYACAAAAIFGHCYPVWFEFVGGKGAATAMGVLFVIAPEVVLPVALVWIGCLLVFGFVGLATVTAAAAAPAWTLLQGADGSGNFLIFAIVLALFIAFTHRSNLRELVAGDARPDIGFSLLGRFG